MENPSFFSTFVFVVLALNLSGVVVCNFDPCQPIAATDNDIFEFALNYAYLETEFFLHAALGRGLDAIDPALVFGGPSPIAPQMANLDPFVHRIMEEFGYEQLGKLRSVIRVSVGGFARPLLNLSKEVFGEAFDAAVGSKLIPPFDPYANTLNFLLAANIIPHNGVVGLVGIIPHLTFPQSRSLAASLLGAASGQNAVIRTLLYEKADEIVVPYNITVAKFTNLTSTLSNRLGKCGIKDEGVVVPRSLGAENRTESNILAADANSLSYARTLQELLRIGYGTGDERVPGGFYPKGANGRIARNFLIRK